MTAAVLTPDAVATGRLRVVRCAAGPLRFALPMAAVARVVRLDPGRWAPAADAGGGVVGVVHVGVRDVPLVDLPGSDGGSFAVLLVVGGELWAVRVGRVFPAADVDASAAVAPPPLVRAACGGAVWKVVPLDGGWEPLLDPARITGGRDESRGTRDTGHGTRDTKPESVDGGRWTADGGPRSTDRGRLVVFRTSAEAAGERPVAIGLAAGLVAEVVPLPPVTPLPFAPDWLGGLAEWRGRPLPVVDLGRRLGLGAFAADVGGRLVVAVPPGGGPVGLLARSGVRAVPLPVPHAACDRDLAVDADLVRGAVELKGETLVVPDLGRVVGS